MAILPPAIAGPGQQRPKVSPQSVHLREAIPNAGKSCGKCGMFQPPASCDLVIGRILRNYVCDEWTPILPAPAL